jgi:mRNA interferase MazF
MMNEAKVFRRGDVVLTHFPYITESSASKERPAVIIQNDMGNRFSPNVIIASISSKVPDREYPFHFLVRVGSPEAEGTGIERDSVLQTENILTISKSNVIKHIGRFSDDAMQRIDECLRVSLDL